MKTTNEARNIWIALALAGVIVGVAIYGMINSSISGGEIESSQVGVSNVGVYASWRGEVANLDQVVLVNSWGVTPVEVLQPSVDQAWNVAVDVPRVGVDKYWSVLDSSVVVSVLDAVDVWTLNELT